MDSSNIIDIVIPVYNEGENILKVLYAFQDQVHSRIRILLCYDHDEDTTLFAIKNHTFTFEVITVKNKGKLAHGAAITGFYHGNSPAVISYMGDDDYNAKVIDQMIEAFNNGAEIVAGSRFIPGGSMQGCRWQKAILVRIVNFTLHYFGGLPVHDSTNAFRLFSRKLLNNVKIESSQGFTYSIELLAKCHRLGWNTYEVPAQWFEREKGISRFKILKWARAYLRWYFYVFATTYLKKQTL